MAHIEKHAPGDFCWLELGTTDRAGAVSFYTQLFSWGTFDVPMGPDTYTIFKLKEKDTGGAYALTEELRARGVPSHWLLYVAVADADDVASRVAPLGGTVVEAPFDVPGVGRCAVVKDPQGVVFALFQAGGHAGLGIRDEAGAFCWPELNTPDKPGALSFYSGLFGWGHKTDEPDNSKAYTEWKLEDRSIGGVMQIQPEWGEVPPHWIPYIMVESCDEATARALSLGGTSIVPPMDIPNVGRFATVRDPQGGHFSVFQSIRRE